jgi:hypothetical protein
MTLNATPGRQLFNSVSDFYSWYMSRIHTPSAHASIFQTLSELMRISSLSAEGGEYLSPEEEKRGVRSLSKLKEKLCDGNLKKEDTLRKLKALIDNITSQNPKAKLVSYATELEYQFCILRPPSPHSEYLQNYLNELLKYVTPSLLGIQAYAITQIIGKILDTTPLHKDTGYILEKEVKQWIRQA